jgi:hypothetical protein
MEDAKRDSRSAVRALRVPCECCYNIISSPILSNHGRGRICVASAEERGISKQGQYVCQEEF